MRTLFLILGLLVAKESSADMFRSTLFQLNTIYVDRDYNDNGINTKAKETDTDFRLMRIEKNWAYGLIYSLSANDSSVSSRTSTGLSVGYYSEKDVYLNLHYFLNSKYSFGGTEYSKGGGYEFDVGFLSKVTSSFYVGLLMAIKNFSYTQSTINGVSSSTSATHKEVIPMFSFGINFM